jgi:four helix bundle protein
MPFKFENLKIWQRAIKISLEIHNLTRSFPKEELYILTSQIKRAADSIALNIAEGSTGQTNAEFKQFLNYTIRSGIEVITCLYIGKDRGIVKVSDFNRLYSAIEEVVKMMQGLRKILV